MLHLLIGVFDVLKTIVKDSVNFETFFKINLVNFLFNNIAAIHRDHKVKDAINNLGIGNDTKESDKIQVINFQAVNDKKSTKISFIAQLK